MPDYTIRDRQTGRTITLRGDSPPTEDEMAQAFQAARPVGSGSTRMASAHAPELSWADTPIQLPIVGGLTVQTSPRGFAKSGALEAAGATAGGLVGNVPGAMAGAGIVRGIRGLATGESPKEAGIAAVLNAALEALPLLGKPVKALGRSIVRNTLPVAEKELEQIGAGSMREGLKRITDRAVQAPGLKLSTTLDNVGSMPRGSEPGTGRMGELAAERARLVADSTSAGIPVSSRNVLDAGDALTQPGGALRESITSPASDSGAQSVVNRFRERVTKEVPMTDAELFEAFKSGAASRPGFKPVNQVVEDLTAAEADAILQNSKFARGSKDVPGSELASKTLRSALSGELKSSAPGLADVMAEQSDLIPLRKVLERASVSGSSTLKPEAIVSGGRSRVFGVVPVPRSAMFPLGKIAARTGAAMGRPPVMSAAARALLAQLLAEQDARQ